MKQRGAQLGDAMAREMLKAVRKTGFTPLLGWIIRDQIRAGLENPAAFGVIVGFTDHICEAAAFMGGHAR